MVHSALTIKYALKIHEDIDFCTPQQLIEVDISIMTKIPPITTGIF